jgi:Putative beta barrel porin-7 (BBP7)
MPGRLSFMHMRIIATVMVLVTNIQLVGAQSPDTAVLPTLDVPTATSSAADGHAPAKYAGFLRCPFLDQPVAANAEDAELLEARACRSPRYWLRAEFMIWWIKTAHFPPLVTTGDSTDRAPGSLDSPSTSVLFGGPGMDFRDRKGGRFAGGAWLDDEQIYGVDARYFFLGGRSINQSFVSAGNPIVATPFFNVNTGLQDSSLATFPGVTSGQIAVNAPTFLQGAEMNLTGALVLMNSCRIDGLVGFRYVNLQEGLQITETSLVTLAPQYVGLVPFNGNTITVNDSFETHNSFFGGQIGARAEWNHKRWSLTLETKVALGVSHEVVSIHGFTGIDTQPATFTNGGLFAVSSNSGQYSRNVLAVIPEAELSLGYQLTNHVRVFAGYNFLYWSNVVRPGDQVDTNVNPNLVPSSMTFGAAGGPARPAFNGRSTDFFAHGANVGMEFRW